MVLYAIIANRKTTTWNDWKKKQEYDRKKHHVMALTLVLLLTTVSGTACAGETSRESTETVPESAAQTETETETTRYAADLPERDFAGETFTFYARIYGGTWDADDLLSEGTTGEKINDALYERQTYI